MRRSGRLLTIRRRCELGRRGNNACRCDDIQGCRQARLKAYRSSCRWLGGQYGRRSKCGVTGASRSEQHRKITRNILIGAITLGKKAGRARWSPRAEGATKTTKFSTGVERINNNRTIRNAMLGELCSRVKTCLGTRFNEEILEV